MSDPQLINVPLGSGLDETLDDALVPPTAMRMCQNVVFPDAATCSKRPGTTQLSALANLKRLARHGDEILAFDGLAMWSWDAATAAFVNRGPTSPCVVRQLPMAAGLQVQSVVTPNTGIQGQAIPPPIGSLAEGNGYRVVLWDDSTAVMASIYDTANKAFVRTSEVLRIKSSASVQGSSQQPRAIVVGTHAVAVYDDAVAGLVRARTMDLTNISAGWSNETTLYTGTATNPATANVFDAYPMPVAGQFGLIVADNVANTIKGYKFTASNLAAQGSVTLKTSAPIIGAIAVRPVEADAIFQYAVTHLNGGSTAVLLAIGCETLDFTTTVMAFTDVATLGNTNDLTTAVSLERKYESSSGQTSQFFLAASYQQVETGTTLTQSRTATSTWVFAASIASLAAIDTTFAQQMMSKVFCVSVNGSNQYFWLSMGSDPSSQPTSELLMYAGDNARINSLFPAWLPVATLTPDYAATQGANRARLPSSALPAAQDVTFPGNTSQSVYTFPGTFVAQSSSNALAMFECDFASTQSFQCVRLGRSTYVASAVPMAYDGVLFCEAGFTQAPPPPSITCTGAGGSVPINAALTYVVCYAQQDDSGNIHRSEPSVPAVVNNGSAGTVKLYLVPYKATYRQVPQIAGVASRHPVVIEIYRNTVATPGVYQLLSIVPNNPSASLQEFDDLAADSVLAGQPAVYTQLGLVAACPWPAMTALAVHADRIFGADADGITTYYTTQLEAGLAPRTVDQFTVLWPEGPISACWSLEGRMHAATSRKIHFLYGDGPNDNGASSDFSSPQLWQSDLGVVDARSFAIASPGVFFLSLKGIYLETRASEFVWIGQKCRRTLAANGNVVSSVVALDNDGAIRFTLAGGSTTGGLSLHYDYRHDRWSTLSYAGIPNIAPGIAGPMISATATSAGWVFGGGLGGTQAVLQETPGSYTDPFSFVPIWVPSNLTTGWVLPGGQMQGWGEVLDSLLLLQQVTPFNLNVTMTRDYLSSSDQIGASTTWNDATVTAFPSQPTVQLRPTSVVQEAEAVSVTITDAAPTSGAGLGTGQGAIFKSLLVKIQPNIDPFPHVQQGAQA